MEVEVDEEDWGCGFAGLGSMKIPTLCCELGARYVRVGLRLLDANRRGPSSCSDWGVCGVISWVISGEQEREKRDLDLWMEVEKGSMVAEAKTAKVVFLLQVRLPQTMIACHAASPSPALCHRS